MTDSHQPKLERFPSTHWSQVNAAAGDDSLASTQALEALLHRYLPALKVHLARKYSVRTDAADDLLQSFVGQKLLDPTFIAAADRQRGKFRSFLLTALDHFLIDQLRKDRAATRQIEHPASSEELPAAGRSPDAFDIAWAKQVIDTTLQNMESECTASGRDDLWKLFNLRVVGPTLRNEPPPPYDQLVARFNFASPTQASNALVTAKRMFERSLRAVVGQYAGSNHSVEGELRDLREILSRAGARSF
jgi:RNA polymerase sigma-70 factor (ECF subfamily)